MSQKNGINCTASWLCILCCSLTLCRIIEILLIWRMIWFPSFLWDHWAPLWRTTLPHCHRSRNIFPLPDSTKLWVIQFFQVHKLIGPYQVVWFHFFWKFITKWTFPIFDIQHQRSYIHYQSDMSKFSKIRYQDSYRLSKSQHSFVNIWSDTFWSSSLIHYQLNASSIITVHYYFIEF